jgi:hypothetical protein
MPLPEGYLPRKGDELLVRARVTYDCEVGDADVHVAMVGAEHKKYMIPLAEIHSLHARKWSEGDRVQNDWGWFEVVAVSDDQVWGKCRGHLNDSGGSIGLKYTFDANDLEPYVEPATDMVALGEEVALNYPAAPPPAPAVVDDEEVAF